MSDTTALVPFADIRSMAEVMGKTGMFGKTPEQLLPLMLIAQAEHKHPAIAAQEYDIIQGRPAINSKSALARFQAAGGRIQWGDRTDAVCTATFAHPQGGELTITWTMDRAQKAGLTNKDNWKKYPTQMLSARVIAEGVRAVFPACLSGMYTAEEVQDMPPLARPKTPIHDRAMYGTEDTHNVEAMRDVTPEPDAEPAQVVKLSEEARGMIAALTEYLESGLLPASGREAIKAAMERGEEDPIILRDLLDRARAAHDKVLARKQGAA